MFFERKVIPSEFKDQSKPVFSDETDPEKLANEIYKKLQESKQNGVACTLNKFEPEVRKKIIDHWKKSHPALAIYFSSSSEINGSLRDFGLFSENQELQHSLSSEGLPASLEHAVKVKLKLISLATLDHARGHSDHRSKAKIRLMEEVQNLFRQSTLHLSFRGCTIVTYGFDSTSNFNFDFSCCDFTDFHFYDNSVFHHCNFSYADFTGAVSSDNTINYCNFTGTIFKKMDGEIDFGHHNIFTNTDLSQIKLRKVFNYGPNSGCIHRDLYSCCDFRQTILSDSQKEMLGSEIHFFVLCEIDSRYRPHDHYPYFMRALLTSRACKSVEDYFTLNWLIGAEDETDLIKRIKEVELPTLSAEFSMQLERALHRHQANPHAGISNLFSKPSEITQSQAIPEPIQPNSNPSQAVEGEINALFGRLFCCRSRRHQSTPENTRVPSGNVNRYGSGGK